MEDGGRREDRSRRHVGRVYWRGPDESLFVEQVQAISFIQICILCRRIYHRTTMSINGRRARTLRKKRDEDEMRGADGLLERPRETSRDTCIVH